MTEHTPGPWRVRAPEFDLVVDGDNNLVCNCRSYAQNEKQRLANAKLIAQAPDLKARAEKAEALVGELLDVTKLALSEINNLVAQVPNDETIANWNLDGAEMTVSALQTALAKAKAEGFHV